MGQENVAGVREPAEVTQFELLAARMPSALARLRPMDATSAGMVRFLTRVPGSVEHTQPRRRTSGSIRAGKRRRNQQARS